MATTEKVLQATIKLKDQYSKPMRVAQKATDNFNKTSKKVKPITLKAKDNATKTIKKVQSNLKKVSKAHIATVKAKDNTSKILGGIKKNLAKLAAGITIGVGVKYTVGEAMNMEAQKASINFWNKKNGGTDKQSQSYMKSLDALSAKSMFDDNSIYSAGARALGVAGNTKDAERYMKIANDMATAIPGKTIQDAIEALADAKNGEWERMKEFNFKGSADTDIKQAFSDIEKRFEGAGTANDGTGLKAYNVAIKNLKKNFKEFGEGVLPLITPTLEKLGNLFSKMTPHFEKAGEAVTKTFNEISKRKDVQQFIENLSKTWNGFWKVAGFLLESAWIIAKPILGALWEVLKAVAKQLADLFDWWGKLADKIKNNPINAVVNTVTNALGANGPSKSKENKKNQAEAGRRNAFGSGRIARNGEVHTLHQGEKVLTRSEADRLNSGASGNISINVASMVVREEADIQKIAKAFANELKKTKLSYGGAF